MGGGGGPPHVNVPEEVIQEAFDNGEDFTLAENETTNLTKDLTIPAEVVFTVKGVLDLGEGNTLTEEGQLIVDGGRIQNENADLVLSGDSTTIFENQGQLDTDGTLTVNKEVKFITTLEDNIWESIRVNTLILGDNAKISLTGLGKTTTMIAYFVRVNNGLYISEGDLNIIINESMTIEKGGELTLNGYVSLGCNRSVVNVEGLLKFDSTSSVGLFDGELNVKNGGSIVGIDEQFRNVIRGGVVNVYGTDSESGNTSYIENCSFIDVHQINIGKIIDNVEHPGKIYLGEYDTDNLFFTSAKQSIEFGKSTTKPMTILTNRGLEYVNVEVLGNPPITFFLDDEEVAFPNGDATVAFGTSFYKLTENPGFTITYDESGDPDPGTSATVSRYENINDNMNIAEIAIDPSK
jgi:hypothetical protein